MNLSTHLLCFCEGDFFLEVDESSRGGADLAKVHFDDLMLGKILEEHGAFSFYKKVIVY